MVSGAAKPFMCIRALPTPTCNLIASLRRAGVPGNAEIWASARLNWASASINTERVKDRCPASPHSAAAFLGQARLCEVPRQQLRLALRDVEESAFESLGDTGVERPTRLPQQSAVGGVLHERVLEEIGRVRRDALPGQQPRLNESIERLGQLR